MNKSPIPVLQFLIDKRLVASRAEGRRLIAQGAVKMNMSRVSMDHQISPNCIHTVHVGRTKHDLTIKETP